MRRCLLPNAFIFTVQLSRQSGRLSRFTPSSNPNRLVIPMRVTGVKGVWITTVCADLPMLFELVLEDDFNTVSQVVVVVQPPDGQFMHAAVKFNQAAHHVHAQVTIAHTGPFPAAVTDPGRSVSPDAKTAFAGEIGGGIQLLENQFVAPGQFAMCADGRAGNAPGPDGQAGWFTAPLIHQLEQLCGGLICQAYRAVAADNQEQS